MSTATKANGERLHQRKVLNVAIHFVSFCFLSKGLLEKRLKRFGTAQQEALDSTPPSKSSCTFRVRMEKEIYEHIAGFDGYNCFHKATK